MSSPTAVSSQPRPLPVLWRACSGLLAGATIYSYVALPAPWNVLAVLAFVTSTWLLPRRLRPSETLTGQRRGWWSAALTVTALAGFLAAPHVGSLRWLLALGLGLFAAAVTWWAFGEPRSKEIEPLRPRPRAD